MPKKLLILRHAEAGHSFSGDDHSRTLTTRGESQARECGRWLAASRSWPEAILISDSMRTRQTCIWLGHELGEKAATPYLDSRLYLAPSRRMLSIINETQESVQTLLVLAHMPGVQELSMDLASVDSDERSVLRMAEHWPTAGAALFDVHKPWAELDGRDAVLAEFRFPGP